MGNIKLFIRLLIIAIPVLSFAQQDPHYTQYTYNMNIVNPAYAGSEGVFSLGILGRSQWVGIEGAPQTYTISANGPIGKSVGFGLSFIHDEIGPAKEDNIYADFSYTIVLSDYSRLALGIKGGITALNVRELDLLESNDPLNEPINTVTPNFGAGAYYYSEKFYVGFSIPNMLKSRYLEKSNLAVSKASDEMHFFLTSGFVFDLYDNVKLKPSTMLIGAKGAPISVDISGNLLWEEKFEVGLSYRFSRSIGGMIGFVMNENMRIGYAYDNNLGSIGDYNSGSHELMLLVNFNKRNMNSPRFF